MGIDYVLFERLAELSTRFAPEGRSLMLGRQKFMVRPKHMRRFERVLRKYDLPYSHDDLVQPDGYSETLLDALGFGAVETMDFSGYEGASILHDLNKPIPEELENQFDFILDGGTIEHVFNVPAALENVFRMLKPGGRFVSANGMNGWPFHGIYQFNPELVWTFWSRGCGCTVHACEGAAIEPSVRPAMVRFEDPAVRGVRLKVKLPEGRVYLYYEVERLDSSELGFTVLQSDYETKWASHGSAGATHLGG